MELSETVLPEEETLLEPELTVLEDLMGELRPDDVFWRISADKGLYACPASETIADGSVVAFERLL